MILTKSSAETTGARNTVLVSQAICIIGFLGVLEIDGGMDAFAQSIPSDSLVDSLSTPEQSYQDWDVICGFGAEIEGAATQQFCEMRQIVRADDPSQPMIPVALQMQDGGSEAILSLVVPFGLLVSEPLTVDLAEMRLLELDILTCLPRGCIATGPISHEIAAQMASHDMAAITMMMGDGAALNATISLGGFVDAWNRIQTDTTLQIETDAIFEAAAVASEPVDVSHSPETIAGEVGPLQQTNPPPERPFTQVGLFRVEANARSSRDQLQRAGLPTEIRLGESQGRPFWRVVIGPARDTVESEKHLDQARVLGFADAYHVSR